MEKTLSTARWFNSTILGIGMASLFSDLSHEMVTALLPSLLASMGVAAGVLGTIEGVADGLSSVAKFYGGWLTDRLARRKPLCVAGYGGMVAATGVMALATTWPIVLLGRGLAWVSRGIRTPARKALLAEAVSPASYGRAFGFERTMDTTGAIVAPLAALSLLAWGWTYGSLLWLAAGLAVLPVLAIIFLVKETPDRECHPRPFLASLRGLPHEFSVFLRGVGLFGAGDFAHSLLILYAVMMLTPSLGAAQATAWSIALYALHNIVYAGISYPAGILADRLDKRKLLAMGYGLGVMMSLLLAFQVHTLPWLALVFILGGACVGIEETLEDSLAAELLPEQTRGIGFGTLAAVNGLGDLVSSLGVGWLWSFYGASVSFGITALLMSAGAFLFWQHRDASPLA